MKEGNDNSHARTRRTRTQGTVREAYSLPRFVEPSGHLTHLIALLQQGGTCEYSFVTALCEIVDNSIEATKSGEREVSISLDLNYSTDLHKRVQLVGLRHHTSQVLVVRDSGHGMNREELNNMMRHSHHEVQKDYTPSGIGNLYPLNLSSNLGRFGVGAKSVALWLGKEIVVTSKRAGDNRNWIISLNEVHICLSHC